MAGGKHVLHSNILPTFQWYYFLRVFRPYSLDSKPWCKRVLRAYIYSSSYCHMAFERIPIVVLCMKPPGKTTNWFCSMYPSGNQQSRLVQHAMMVSRIWGRLYAAQTRRIASCALLMFLLFNSFSTSVCIITWTQTLFIWWSVDR